MHRSKEFDAKYYDGIWGTVHRHDYCQDLAERLVKQYGKGRILDIGTGCGFLVKVLREMGCDAWGLEISDYALVNSCDHDHVCYGTVWDIPFERNRFDVVHSNGLWEYVPKNRIQKAWEECRRVGFHQLHNIDTTQSEYHDGFETYESGEWWAKQLVYPKVLIACPNHECKEYAFAAWIDSVHKLDYPNKEYLVVDNSPTTAFLERWRDKVPMVHLDFPFDMTANKRIAESMEYVRKYFLASDAKYWFSLESDIVLPVAGLRYLIGLGDFDWNEHHYPYRNHPELPPSLGGFGCVLFSKRIVENNSLEDAPSDTTTDGWFWNNKVLKDLNYHRYRVIESYNVLDIQHLYSGVGD